MDALPSKLKILCCGGWRTNAKVFLHQLQLSGILHATKHLVDYVPINPCHDAGGRADARVIKLDPAGQYYQWWFTQYEDPQGLIGKLMEGSDVTADSQMKIMQAQSLRCFYSGVEDTLNYLAHVLVSQGPFDGLFGFSQGGCCVALLAALAAKGDPRFAGKFRFVMPACAFRPCDVDVCKALNDVTPIKDIPSLHMYSPSDAIYSRSKALVKDFENANIIQHDKGHQFPQTTSGEAKLELIYFLERMLDNKKRLKHEYAVSG